MGGYQAGEVASDIVKQTVFDRIVAGASLAQAVQAGHQAVIAAGTEGVGVPGMGATIVAVRLAGDGYEVAWVGDSRVYLWDGAVLHQVTSDHSVVQQLLDGGVITEQEALTHPNRNLVTQALGVLDVEQVSVDVVRGEFLRGERLMLCSDGLSDEVTDDAIGAIFSAGDDDQVTAQRLVDEALARGGRDNVTVIVLSARTDAPETHAQSAPAADSKVPTAPLEPGAGTRRQRLLPFLYPVAGALLALLLVLAWRHWI